MMILNGYGHWDDPASDPSVVAVLEAIGVLPELTPERREALESALDVQAEYAYRAGWNACVRDAQRNGGEALPLGAARDRSGMTSS